MKFEPSSSFRSKVIVPKDGQTWQSYKPNGWAKNTIKMSGGQGRFCFVLNLVQFLIKRYTRPWT
jgi:hypothetical protein